MKSSFLVGGYCDVAHCGVAVEKVTKDSYEPAEAVRIAALLERYVTELEGEPIRVASVREIALLSDGDTAKVGHTMDHIDGTNVMDMPVDALRASVAEFITHMVAMSRLQTNGTMLTPLDPNPFNLMRSNNGGLYVVDVFPPLSRGNGGLMEYWPEGLALVMEREFGTIQAAASLILVSAAVPHTGDLAESRDWCMDTLPQDLGGQLRGQIGAQLDLRLAAHSRM